MDGIASPNFEYQQPIYNATGNVNNKIENKNLFDSSNLINWYVNYSEPIGYSSNVYCGINQFLKLKPNTSYTISTKQNISRLFMPIYDKDYNVLRQAIIADGNQVTFTTASNEQYVKMSFSLDRTTAMNPNNYKEFIQLEEGTTATSYEEHQEQNYPFTFAEGQRGMLGTTLQDDGIHNKMTHSTINITSIIPLSNGNIGGIISLPNKTHKSNNYLLCNKAIFNNSRETGTIYENSLNAVIVGTPTDTLETMQEKYNGSIVEYELETEEIEPYNETQASQYNAIKKAMSYNDQTNISSESDEVGMIIDATAVGDINKAISNIDSRVSLLE